MWKSIQTFISLFYLDLYSLLLSLKYTVATEKVKLTIVNVRTVFFKKWNDLFWALVSIYWLGSESENIMYYKKSKNLWKLVLMKTPQHWIHPKVQILTRSPKTYENSTTLNISESANINKKSQNLWKLPGQLEYRYLKLQILIRSQKNLWKLHNIEYILEQLWWMRVQQF